MWEALEHAGWVSTLATSRWIYGLVSVIHHSAVLFSIGTIVLLDLRILGGNQTLAVEWSVATCDRARVMPVTAKLLALISIVLWLGALLAAVEISELTGLG